MKSLEEQVNDIKEKIFRTKARLLLLQETVVGGDIVSGARAVIIHKNEMGSTFVLTSVAYALDGQPIFTKVDVNGDLSGKDQIEIFNGRIVPGTHQLTVKLQYTGHGFGPISYLEGYKVSLASSYTFNAEGGKATTVNAIGYEKGGPFAEYKDKPDVKYETSVSKVAAPKDSGDKPAEKPSADAKPAPTP
ncbi:MAG: dihydrolipoamide acetyltransferase [Deltaproteobacteria bacterium]|nr:dihydrolipoamide acetyltransferase [Deltaproteobacteria bacterium]